MPASPHNSKTASEDGKHDPQRGRKAFPLASLGGWAVLGLVALGVGVIVGAAWHALAPTPAGAQPDATALAALSTAGDELRRHIAHVVRPAIERTRKLAADANLIAALRSADRARETDACNRAVTGATEIDAFALFDAAGRITAINTVYASGDPIARERVERILKMDFDGREIIQRCVRNDAERQVLEFQTTCDITPAFFDSTGLSVAVSIPIHDPQSGERIGVASSRLRFERISELIRAGGVGGARGAAELVTDQGGYFSEAINSGQQPPPMGSEQLRELIAPLVRGQSDRVLSRVGDDYVSIFRLTDFATLDNGGIQVMLLAGADWALREARQARWFQSCVLLLIGVLLLLPALLIHGIMQSTRARRVLERQKRQLQAHIQKRIRAEAERNALQASLVETSRKAGMAEIATGVLHNVGNALNSVNVSTTLTADRVRKLRVESLSRASSMLTEHANDLPQFLAQDEKGRHLPTFVQQFADYLASEQQYLITELGTLAERVEHIKAVVSTQQSYAGMRGVAESVSLAAVIDDALRMNAESHQRHAVEVVRELADLPNVVTDKHKLLQILLNVLNNAKQAMCEPGVATRRLTIRTRVEPGDPDRCLVEISDTGVGIPPENLTRIFAHGFTTRADGHGFGLHSSANAATELGGALRARSDGPGRGATFTLELPMRAAEVRS